MAAGELAREVNPTRLPGTVEAILGGSMPSWAYYEEGTPTQWLRDDLNAVLKPRRRSGRRSSVGE